MYHITHCMKQRKHKGWFSFTLLSPEWVEGSFIVIEILISFQLILLFSLSISFSSRLVSSVQRYELTWPGRVNPLLDGRKTIKWTLSLWQASEWKKKKKKNNKCVPTIGCSPEQGPTCQHTFVCLFVSILILQLNVEYTMWVGQRKCLF